ncbi:MAG: tRNA uridine-5-carboxymethylaminomethyl(34) synthesis GTPase MnmE [Gammaproteobacteria bacterium]|jgi:tRNA modification GTPase|nr:tRNA uridine-5-carboxymethylaminomethyl(34) synthesis GTPase MnmE [Gammaproteobacteria bacterium]
MVYYAQLRKSHTQKQMIRLYNEDTIVAPATAQGRAGIGVVRVSGPLCATIAKTIAGALPQERLATYRPFYDSDHNLIDKGLIIYFKAPHSFTGEAVLEFHLHGSPVLLDLMVQAILQQGARLARPGEFSERAFYNQKIDLAQAEAIADLIAAGSATAARSALKSLEGEFSRLINALVDKVVHLRMYVEAALDFPDEEIDFIGDKQVADKLATIDAALQTILRQAEKGVLLQEGITIVLAGKPNAGKSSLLNYLSGKDSAIVTPIPGTTRDILQEYIQIEGVPLHLIDTAGLRNSDDVVEQEGIRRALFALDKAQHILWLIDGEQEKLDNVETYLKTIPLDKNYHDRVTLVYNKIDLSTQTARSSQEAGHTVLYLSIKTGQGLDLLQQHLKSILNLNDNEANFIARRRHLAALAAAQDALAKAKEALHARLAGELLAEDLKVMQNSLSEITGEFTTDDLLGKIFSEFCIGK